MVQICVGGLAYEKEFFTLRVAENYANTPTAPEAVLHKLGAPWDLERISIHIRDGRVFTGENALRDYLQALGVEVVFHPSTWKFLYHAPVLEVVASVRGKLQGRWSTDTTCSSESRETRCLALPLRTDACYLQDTSPQKHLWTRR